MLKLTEITKDYKVASGCVHALKGVTLEFRKNEFVCILGASGCGKTTLLNIIGGLDHYTSGDLVIQGRSTKDFKDRDWDVYRNHRIGFVFQTYNLIPHQTVLSNVELALTIAGVGKEERRRRAKEALERVGLGEELSKRPNQLSGGQMQRVAIARALVNDPDILLADEPTGALDSKTSVAIMDLIKEIAGERLVIMVTHNPELAESYASRIVRLKDGVVESDSNPYHSDEETQNVAPMSEDAPSETPSSEASSKEPEEGSAPGKREKKARAKMGFFTSLALSFRNLLTKKGRTIITSFGGSIGIISVCLVLALSNGFGNYIRKTEEDMLSAYPLQISESTFDLSAVMDGVMSPQDIPDLTELGDKVYINSFLTGLAQGVAVQNNVTPDYVAYLEEGMKAAPEDYAAIQYRYGFNLADALFTPMKATNAGRFCFVDGDKYDETNWLELTNNVSATGTKKDITDGTWTMGLGDNPSDESKAERRNGTFEYNTKTGAFTLYEEVANEGAGQEQGEKTQKSVYAAGTRTKGEIVETISVTTAGEEKQSFTFRRDNFVMRNFSVTSLKNYLIDKLVAEAPEYRSLLQFVHFFTDVINKMPGTTSFSDPAYASYVASQYDVVSGKLPTKEDEAVLVIGPNNDVIDLTLVQLGFLDEEQFLDLFRDAQKATEESVEAAKAAATPVEDGKLSPEEENKRLAFSRILEQEYMLYYSDAIYAKNEDYNGEDSLANSSLRGGYPFEYNGEVTDEQFAEANEEDGIRFHISGILRLKEGLSYGCLEEGLNFPEATIENYIDHNKQSEIVKWIQDESAIPEKLMKQITSYPGFPAIYSGLKLYFSPAAQLDGSYTSFAIPMFGTAHIGVSNATAVRSIGGSDEVSELSIYPTNFEAKQHIKAYLDQWNDGEAELRNEAIEKWNEEHPDDLRPLNENITYTDQMGMIMSMVETIFNLISYVLVAFTAISLVVSSVMIGIITYVSVVERVKEIGVLRSLGARKMDIRNLFNAETFMIGLASGLIGVIVAYILSGIVSAVLFSLTGIAGMATLAPLTAFIMICISIVLTLISGLIPAQAAAKKDPVIALRTE